MSKTVVLVGALDTKGEEFAHVRRLIEDRALDPVADRACFDAIRAMVRADVPVIEVDAHINDPAFADRAVEELLRMLRG